jgi:hypothetical protein
MQVEVERLRDYYLKLSGVSRSVVGWLADSWAWKAEECSQLLTLFKEMKMQPSDWARMKELAQLSREYRLGE